MAFLEETLMRRLRIVPVLAAGLFGTMGGCSKSGSSGSNDIGAALGDFLQKAPAAYCSWRISCGKLPESELDTCTGEIQAELTGRAGCTALQQLYESRRAAADACLAGEVGTCGTDDFGDFCPAFEGVDLGKVCAAPDAGGPTRDVGLPKLTAAQAVVGAWFGSKTCSSTAIELGYLVCPKGRLNGYEKVGGHNFLDCGTWTVEGNRLTAKYKATAVADPTVKTDATFQFTYQAATDTLTWVSATCPLVLKRLQGQTKEDDCTSATCTAGGTGPITGCSIDCDCGRCWYCEKGTCRYGGEGPYGCYRGCGP